MTTMTDKPGRMNAGVLAEALAAAVEDALGQMFFTAAWPACSVAAPGDGFACSSIEFAGQQSGVLMVAAPPTTVDRLLASLQGEEEVTATAAQQAMLLGELANMLCGQMISRCDPEWPLRLGLPTARPASVAQPPDHDLSLESDAGPLRVSLWLTEGEGVG